ncbi:glycogen/starch/alpha-glucan phosphorylase [Clostridium sp. Marseille-P299]|uniref:glycogen/starch/alpha-glucan phosphorylase n=1 Tax=Clostridium sp. Marseille-P299 TaxID=1805477 RepID=UPI000B1F0586|nr:glycogen/starch/alpha-glucan phosphorylase [Clostridium sp. Marseille-P299]
MELNKEVLKRNIETNLKTHFFCNIKEANEQQIYQAVAYALKDFIIDWWIATQKKCEELDVKRVYYLSMEFLIGRTLGNTLINLNANTIVKEVLEELGICLNVIEDQEPDAGLGNGGLGRLAACFLESLSSLSYPAYGCGIRYKHGMFKQRIVDGYQVEIPDEWLKEGNPFELKRSDYSQIIKFGGYVRVKKDELNRDCFVQENFQSIEAIPYDIPVVGYGNHMVNTLRIWDAKAINSLDLNALNKGDYAKALEQENIASLICEVLYPNDSHYAGKELRLRQQYFFVSASVQSAVKQYMKSHKDIKNIHEKVCFQLNDTHPTVAIPELMRILMDEYNISWDDAWEIATKSCAYTNHTILSEALEKWPIELFQKLLPRVYQIIEEINRRFIIFLKERYPSNNHKIETMAILYNDQVKMANLAVVACFSINGVAKLHTEILKREQLKDFYELWPDKFNNKTNGITQRRFLLHGNPLLSEWITSKIGEDWIVDLSKLDELSPLIEDKTALREFAEIKYKNKCRLAAYIKEHNGIEVDPNSLFDVQVKRLHEYKRQLLNILHIMHLYNQLKSNKDLEFHKRTFIFGAKASPSYRRAKEIIKLINAVAETINNDVSIEGKIKIVFIENYCVSNAELIFAAADISEQISTASKEASGTGNMKFMLNGALTLGTLDGANIEIVEEVGENHSFMFGLTSDEVIEYENHGGYNPREIYQSDSEIKKVLDQLIDGTYSAGNKELFKELYQSLIETNGYESADRYFILKDFRAYEAIQKQVEFVYKNKEKWTKSSLLNVAKCGKFSSDRTIEEYVKEIWHLEKVTITM